MQLLNDLLRLLLATGRGDGVTDLTVVSLFDGIGGFPLAFERVGAKTVATVEIDKPAAPISKRHFPNAHQFDDVTEVTGDDLRSGLVRISLPAIPGGRMNDASLHTRNGL